MKKTQIIYDNIFYEKNIILKNSINYIFFKKLKFLERKNKFVNYYFYNFFLKNYKNNNLQIYLNYFLKNDLNKQFFIFNKNNFKNQFFYNINDLKIFCLNNKFKFLFLKKNLNFNFFFNNCILINNLNKNNIKDNGVFLNNFDLLDINFKYININTDLIFFLNFNIYLYNILEFYKIFILLFLIKN